MTKTSNGLPLTIPLEIPAYWTPEQAFAVVELLDDLRDRIWAHYSAQLLEGGAAGVGYLLKDRVANVAEFAAALERVLDVLARR